MRPQRYSQGLVSTRKAGGRLREIALALLSVWFVSASGLAQAQEKKSGGPDLKVYPIGRKPEDLAREVNQFHQRLADRHPDYASLGRELYSLLIEPAAQQLSGINTICIVPDGFLWNLPFQALMNKSGRYLIEDHSLYYAPSLSVLREMTKRIVEPEKKRASLIAFGNPVIGKDEQRNEEQCPLPEAETEVATVAKALDPVGSKVLIGRRQLKRCSRLLRRLIQ